MCHRLLGRRPLQKAGGPDARAHGANGGPCSQLAFFAPLTSSLDSPSADNVVDNFRDMAVSPPLRFPLRRDSRNSLEKSQKYEAYMAIAQYTVIDWIWQAPVRK
mmetsp:Transcript_94331/g.272651  ORF Transcript_94331/g.272651 Transcript_94331/m.272651 type:complete len:104 (-) Transcript_94331:756-1067(-)